MIVFLVADSAGQQGQLSRQLLRVPLKAVLVSRNWMEGRRAVVMVVGRSGQEEGYGGMGGDWGAIIK
jgi:hypothetical protein